MNWSDRRVDRRVRGRRIGSSALAICLVLSVCAGSLAAQAPSEDPVLEVIGVEFGTVRLGSNSIHVRVRNVSDEPMIALVDVRAVPGMWMIPNQQGQFHAELQPGAVTTIEGTFEFQRLSIEATLRVTVGPGRLMPQDYYWFRSMDFRETYEVGAGSPDAYDPARDFTRVRRGPLEIWAWKSSRAQERIEEIATERLEALRAIESMLGVQVSGQIRLVLYADEETKIEQTGHRGVGWARGRTLVEVYNDEVRLDPYHELAHIVAGEVGSPPPLLNEGFAIYATERLGGDALEFLGNPGVPADRVVCRVAGTSAYLPLEEMVALENIGSDESRSAREYAEAGSLVKHLVDTHGLDRFQQAYAALEAGADDNVARLEEIYGISLERMESDWLTATSAACDR